MNHSRRRFIELGGATTAALVAGGCAGRDSAAGGADDTGGASAPGRTPEPPRWVPPGDIDEGVFPSGVQTGDPRPDGVVASVWTSATAVALVVMRAEGVDGWVESSRRAELVPVDGVLQLEVDGLEPDTAYNIAFEDEGGGGWSAVARVRTALAADGLRVIRFGATSCLGGNAPWKTLTHAATAELDFFAFLGDTVYADGATSLEEYRLFWNLARTTKGFRDVTASTAMVATWDDHEVGNNWSPATLAPGQLDAAVQAFREAMPQRVGEEGSTLWRRLSFGATLDVFVLDCRGERAGSDYLSRTQMDWLKAGLADSTARFKIILNSVPITDLTAIFGQGARDDRWEGYPAQRAEILGFIEEAGVEGLLWVAGDVHYPQVASVDPEGGLADGQVEVLAGPGGSFLNIGADLFQGDPQYWWMAAEWNYACFTCDPVEGSILVEHIGDGGDVLNATRLFL